MSAPTVEQLMALPPEFLAEVNPTKDRLLSTSVAFIVLNTIFFGLYLIATHMNRVTAPLELYFVMPLAYLGVLGTILIALLLVTNGGLGRHIAFHLLNDPNTFNTFLKLQTGVEITYMAAITLPKIAILMLYLRIFVDRTARILAWVMIGVLVAFFFSGLILAFALCRPQWISIPSIITDLFIFIIPIPTIWKLHMNRWKKVGVLLTFMTGSLGFITAIVRCITFYESDLLSDTTWLAGNTMIWTVVEASAYFICACLPRLRILLSWFLEKTGFSKFIISTVGTAWTIRRGATKDLGSDASGARNPKPSVGNGKSFGNTFGNTFGSTYGSKHDDDTVGFVQLDELTLEIGGGRAGSGSHAHSDAESRR